MASGTRNVLKAIAGCQRQLLNRGTSSSVSKISPRLLPVRTFAAVKAVKKFGKKKEEVVEKDVKKEKVVINDEGRHKPYGKTAWVPVDDVYVQRFYPQPAYDPMSAIDALKTFQVLDFTDHDQPVYIDLKLDMKLEKKKKVDAFVSTVHLPHPFKKELNTVVVFTENPDQARIAQENGALRVGGAELIEKILEDELTADFYVAVPDMLPKLLPLKNKLRKKFPKSKRGSVGINIPKMVALFKTGHQYNVVDECYVRTQIATLDMPREHIFSNLQTLLVDVCSNRPASYGHFIERAIMTSHTSEPLRFNSTDVLPAPPEEKD